MRDLLKHFYNSTLNKILVIFTIFFFIGSLGISFHRILFEDNRIFLYWKGFDPISLIFGAFTFFVSLLITLKIEKNTSEQMRLKELETNAKNEELATDNSYIKKKTDEIKFNIESLIKQYQNVEVTTNFNDIMEQLRSLYSTTIYAQEGKLEYEGSAKKVDMQLKIMNHSAAFGRLLCSDVDVLRKEDPDFEETKKDKNRLKDLIMKTRNRQKSVYLRMIQALNVIPKKEDKYYITLSATKKIDGTDTTDHMETAYNQKYLMKLNVENETCFYENYVDDKRFIQKVDGSFSEYLIKDKQAKQIRELSQLCEVYDAYSFTIPFQAFITLPIDDTIDNEKFYRCIFFFINDNTIGKELPLSAICTSNINFVKSISNALDAEKMTLHQYEHK